MGFILVFLSFFLLIYFCLFIIFIIIIIVIIIFGGAGGGHLHIYVNMVPVKAAVCIRSSK